MNRVVLMVYSILFFIIILVMGAILYLSDEIETPRWFMGVLVAALLGHTVFIFYQASKIDDQITEYERKKKSKKKGEGER